MTAGLNILMMDHAPIIHNYDKPDIIFVNTMMNHVRGTDVIPEMRKDSYFDKTPILLQTCYAINSEGRRVLEELNIIHVLAKPYTKSQFLKCIDTYVGYFPEDNRSN